MSLDATILAMAVLTFALRLTGFLLPTARLAPYWRRWLDHVPAAVFAALIATSLPGRSPTDSAVRTLCLALGAVLLARRAPLWLVLALCLAAYLALQGTLL
jgi:branched-subunit amino acid transport protein